MIDTGEERTLESVCAQARSTRSGGNSRKQPHHQLHSSAVHFEGFGRSFKLHNPCALARLVAALHEQDRRHVHRLAHHLAAADAVAAETFLPVRGKIVLVEAGCSSESRQKRDEPAMPLLQSKNNYKA